MKKEKNDVLERTKIPKSLSEKMDSYCLRHGWSRSKLLREALLHFLDYEASRVERDIRDMKTDIDDLKLSFQTLVQLLQQQENNRSGTD